ncbi:MAG: multidrug effflux MFS transporter, partial [Desulfovibrionaceae bacterium]|nr:multidrug effflux MFS transporter [Desulfovibrionaceae bacterium]
TLPELTTHFTASPSVVQLSLTAAMLGLAAGQILLGPVSDRYGRRLPLLVCLAVFTLATAGCLLSPAIEPFLFFRLLQGLSGAGGLVISKAMIADSFTAFEMAKYFAILAAVQGAAPVAAPVLGGVTFSLTCWQGVFVVLGLWGVMLLAVCRNLKETLAPEDRLKGPLPGAFAACGAVVRNARYMFMNGVQAFASASMLSYIAASPFIFQEHYGLSPLANGLVFAANSLALIAGSALVMRLKKLEQALLAGAAGQLVCAVLAGCALSFGWPLALFELPLVPMLFCVGLLTPLGNSLAISAADRHRGTASALLGALPFLLAAICAPITGTGDILTPTTVLMVLCAGVTFGACLVTRHWTYSLTGTAEAGTEEAGTPETASEEQAGEKTR